MSLVVGSSSFADSHFQPQSPDDFCEKVNSTWVASTDIRADQPWNGEFVEAYNRVHEQIKSIVVSSATDERSISNRTVNTFYQSALDNKTRDRLKLKPLAEDMREIAKLHSPADLARLMASFNRRHQASTEGTPVPFVLQIWTSDRDSSRYTPVLLQSGLGLPSREYYLDADPRVSRIREKYLAYMERIFALAGDRQSKTSAKAAFDMEMKIAQLHWTEVQTQDRSLRREMSIKELHHMAPGFLWNTYFQSAGLKRGALISVQQPSFIAAVVSLLKKLPPGKVASYFRWQLLSHYSPYLTPSMANNVAKFRQSLYGSASVPTDEDAAINLVQSYLPTELDAAYIKKYFTPASKLAAQQIAERIRVVFLRRVENSNWLSAVAKMEAVKKLQSLRIEIGYPDQLPIAEPIDLDTHQLIGNLIKISRRNYLNGLRNLSRKVDRTAWWSSVTDIGGSYTQEVNTLIIPAGRLQASLFDINGSDAYNLGGLGSLIGHEIGHALDNQGSQHDAVGSVRDWWTSNDHVAFTQRTSALIAQYSSYEPMPMLHVDGAATLSENIADLSGLTLAYEALRLNAPSGELSQQERERFFEAWARRWRVKYTDAMLVRVLKSDSHPPYQYRCSGPLRNFAPFFDTYNLPVPMDMVSIW